MLGKKCLRSVGRRHLYGSVDAYSREIARRYRTSFTTTSKRRKHLERECERRQHRGALGNIKRRKDVLRALCASFAYLRGQNVFLISADLPE